MSSSLAAVRDEVYTRILLKKSVSGYVNNLFSLVKTWQPLDTLENLEQNHEHGKLYVVCHTPGDISRVDSKGPSKAVTRDFAVYLGFQKVIADVSSISELDENAELIEQFENTCRKEFNLDGYQFVMIDYMKDDRGQPNSFIVQRKALVFETYFKVHYLTTLY